MELQPDTSVSLLDTDLEADVTPSQDFLDRMEAEQAAARKAAEAAAELEAEASRRAADAAAVRNLFLQPLIRFEHFAWYLVVVLV